MPGVRRARHPLHPLPGVRRIGGGMRPELAALVEAARHVRRGCDCEYDYRCSNCESVVSLVHALTAYDAAPPCEHTRLAIVIEHTAGRGPVELWCKDCGALGWPGAWRLPGAEP